MRFKKYSAVKAALFVLLSLPLQADVTITQLANEGVIISAGGTQVMIDGMVTESYAVYGGLPETTAAELEKASGPFSGIDLALVSHRHHDHNQPAPACRFMLSSESTHLASSEQVIGLMREKCRPLMTESPRVRKISPQYGVPVELNRESASVTVFPLSHGTRKYARIENFGHLVQLGGVTLLHVGDAAMDPADFETAGLGDVAVDVAFIPFWFFQPGPGSAVIEQYMNATLKIAVHIPPSEMEEVKAHLAENYPQVLVLDRPLAETRFIASPKP